MYNDSPTNNLPLKSYWPIWLRRLSHWIMASAVRVFLLTMAALLGTLLLNGIVQGAGESRPLLEAVTALMPQLNP